MAEIPIIKDINYFTKKQKNNFVIKRAIKKSDCENQKISSF